MAETKRRPVSDTCETIVDRHPCGLPAVLAYEAMGGGYHAMCAPHAEKHKAYCMSIADARRGRKVVLPPVTPRHRNPAPARVRPTPKTKPAVEAVRARGSATIQEIANALGWSYPSAAFALIQARRSGLLTAQRVDVRLRYEIAPSAPSPIPEPETRHG